MKIPVRTNKYVFAAQEQAKELRERMDILESIIGEEEMNERLAQLPKRMLVSDLEEFLQHEINLATAENAECQQPLIAEESSPAASGA